MTNDIAVLQDEIRAMSDDPAGLEDLYRKAQAEGSEAAFREALRQCEEKDPNNVLLHAWVHRLGLELERGVAGQTRKRHWGVIIAASIVLGVFSALLANGEPPVHDPKETSDQFWVWWGPLIAVGLLAYLAWAEKTKRGLARYGAAALTIVLVALYVWFTIGDREDDVAVLGLIHLPFVSWAAVGAALCIGYSNPARQSFAYLVKSVEAVLTGGIFFGAGLIFVGLTYGIFAAIGIQLPEEDLVVVAGWGVGAIPLLAIGSVYDATTSPTAQDWHTGLTRTLRILARLLLPLALGVLLVYVLWFIPVYFRKGFEEREVLFVYNVTILAIMILLAVVVSGPADGAAARRGSLFQYAVFALGGLTIILNLYALVAILSRTFDAGLTPNRFAVIGWNVATLLILVGSAVRIWRVRRRLWLEVLRESLGMLAPLAAVWGMLLLVALPFLG